MLVQCKCSLSVKRYEEGKLVQGKNVQQCTAHPACLCVCVSDGNLDDLGHFLAEQ